MDIRAQAARDAKIFQRLNEEWTFDTMRLDGHRGFFTRPGKSVQVRMSGEYMFKGWRSSDGKEWDFRITRKFSTFMFQWRTSIKKGQRIILKEYNSGNSRDVIRIPVLDNFIDPLDPSAEEMLFLHMMYPSLAEVWQSLEVAMEDMYLKLS